MVSEEWKNLANWNLQFFHLHINITCAWLDPTYTFIFHVGYVANLKESVIQILQGTESSVLERADAPRLLSSDYGHPDKQAAVNALKSRFRKWLSSPGSSSSLKAILQYIDKWIKMVNFKLKFWSVKGVLINNIRAWDKEKFWVPTRNQSHDLLKTVWTLYPLSYENSWTERSFKWVHMWQVLLKFRMLWIPNEARYWAVKL